MVVGWAGGGDELEEGQGEGEDAELLGLGNEGWEGLVRNRQSVFDPVLQWASTWTHTPHLGQSLLLILINLSGLSLCPVTLVSVPIRS